MGVKYGGVGEWKMLMKITSYYLLAIVAIFTTTAISAELLTNPGFESDLTGWTVTSSNASAAILTTKFHSGTKSARLETSSNPAYVNATQNIPYNGSTEYTLTAYAMDNWSNGGNAMTDAVILKIEYYNASSTLLRADTASLVMPKDYSWHFYTLTSTDIPAGTVTVKPVIGTIQFNEWMRSILFDDVSFTGITVVPPQPHTGDLNNDLYVNFKDFSLLAGIWGQTADWEDLFAMAYNWLADYSNPLTIVPTAQTVEKYDHIFFDINSVSPYTNQYNPDDIRIDIILTDPDSNQIVLPCFYVSGNASASRWQGRFTPQKTGQYSYQAKVWVDGVFDGISNTAYFTSINSTLDGILHKNPSSYYFWKHDSGKAFRGIGENIAWDTRSYNNLYYHYEYMFPMLGDRGCNFVRIWLCEWNIPIEWAILGKYTESAAARLETVFDLAEENGIYLLMSLNTYSEFKSVLNPWGTGDDWVRNPYNIANGGPCATQASFFTNTTAKKLYKNKLRYLIARWGYHPNLGVIEFFNEVDHLYNDGDADVPGADIVSWHNEMSTHLKSIDPFKHLVTTSFSYKTMPNLWNVSNIDFTQTHPYGSTDGVYNTITGYESNFSKPYVMNEFGYSWESAGTSSNHYLFRRELHMGMWRGMFSPTPALPMVWWWENLAYYNDWDVFQHTATFSNQIVADSSGYLAGQTASAGTNFETMGIKTTDKMFVWLRNKSASTQSSATLTLSSVANGSYQVTYYNTWTGAYASPTTINVTTGTLSSLIPSLTADSDIACRIVKLP
jgi:hypothetical protein